MRFGLFFGILALVVLLIAGLGWESREIQADLLSHTENTLEEQNLSWIDASMDGRDLTVRGTPPDQAEQNRAEEALRSIPGLRVIHNHLGQSDSLLALRDSSGQAADGTDTLNNAADNQEDNTDDAQGQQASVDTIPPVQKGLEVNASLALADRCQQSIHAAFNKEKIQFRINTSETLPSSNKLLTRLLKASRDCKGVDLTIAGYTDSQGSADVNLKLSEARAIAIKKYLVKHGAHAASLNTVGFGESKPIADNKTRSGRAKNRRIEIYTGG